MPEGIGYETLTPEEMARMEAGLPPSDATLDALEEEAAEIGAAEVAVNIPVGTWTMPRLNAVLASLNKFLALIEAEPISGDLTPGKGVPLNDELFAGLLAFKTIAEAFGEYDIGEIIKYSSDADLAQASAVIAQAMADREFKRFLLEESPPGEEIEEPVPGEIEEDIEVEVYDDATQSELELL